MWEILTAVAVMGLIWALAWVLMHRESRKRR